MLPANRIRQAGFSMIDQACAVGGMFLVNVMLARTQSKADYGLFALSYSIYTFLAGMHNAALLEPFTVYGSGRYFERFTQYNAKVWGSNARLVAGITCVSLTIWLLLRILKAPLASGALLGMGLSCGVPLTASLVRQSFYVPRKPALAARFSCVFFVALLVLLAAAVRTHWLTSFSAFPLVAAAWMAAGISVYSHLPGKLQPGPESNFGPAYWSLHWKYARWVIATALVFQLTNQAYYWLVAGFLSLKEVADLRAIYILVTPVDQIFIALGFLVLPALSHRFSAGLLDRFRALRKKYMALSIAVTLSFALIVRFLGSMGLHALYGGKFDSIAPLLILLAFLPVIMSIGNTINLALKAIEQPQCVLYGYISSGIATFAVGMPLVRHFGLRGAVYGLLLSASAYTLAVALSWLIVSPRHGFVSGSTASLRTPLPSAANEPEVLAE